MFRVGIGYDIHKFSQNRKLFLGGVEIPFSKGLKGHSDADVAVHAICDALLGAMGEGDIGQHFPDTDRKYKDISSLDLLKDVAKILKKRSFIVENIDVMILLEAPRIASFRAKMIRSIAEALHINKTRVSIKATTHEGIGDIGKGKAASAHAIALVRNKHHNVRRRRI